jgi:hypothetical protein
LIIRLLANLKIHWRNWKVRGTGKAYRALTQAMRDDPGYALSWQCNIAMPILDGAKGKLTRAEANAIADDLMSHLFAVKQPDTVCARIHGRCSTGAGSGSR